MKTLWRSVEIPFLLLCVLGGRAHATIDPWTMGTPAPGTDFTQSQIVTGIGMATDTGLTARFSFQQWSDNTLDWVPWGHKIVTSGWLVYWAVWTDTLDPADYNLPNDKWPLSAMGPMPPMRKKDYRARLQPDNNNPFQCISADLRVLPDP